jgi:hypothetical protein
MNSQRHAKGDLVVVCQKPYTREGMEGTARLEKFIGEDDMPGYERWWVRFAVASNETPMQFEEMIYERIIQP